MGSLYLTDLPAFFEKWGVPYELYPGWETRSRSTGGFNSNDPKAIFIHHTASDTSCDNDVHYCAVGHQDAPVGNGVLCRSGVFHFFAAGAANCQGKGGPVNTSSGQIPLDTGNSQGFAIEASCNGVGQPWTPEQIHTYPLLCAALSDRLDMKPLTDTISHTEWAPTRKCDPAGPSPWMPASGPGCSPATNGITWNEDLFRQTVNQLLLSGPGSEPPEDDDMAGFYYKDSRYQNVWLMGQGPATQVPTSVLQGVTLPRYEAAHDQTLSCVVFQAWGCETVQEAVSKGYLV